MVDKPVNVFSQYSRATLADFKSLQSRKKDLSPKPQSPRQIICYDTNFELTKKGLSNVQINIDKSIPRNKLQQ